MEWIHENIEGFGGDPDLVTIWVSPTLGRSLIRKSLYSRLHGESAGGYSVNDLNMAYGGQNSGLFKREFMSEAAIRTFSDDHPILAILNRSKHRPLATAAKLTNIVGYRAFAYRIGFVTRFVNPGGTIDTLFPFPGTAAAQFTQQTLLLRHRRLLPSQLFLHRPLHPRPVQLRLRAFTKALYLF